MKARIISEIEAEGPMTFDVYMEMCLYDPDEGFFSAGPVRSGKQGDFVTSPEITWAFGYCVGEWVESVSYPWSEQMEDSGSGGVGSREPTALVEVGAGSGSLLRELSDGWFYNDFPVYVVERSRAARATLGERFPKAGVVGMIDEIPTGIDVTIVANEILDNMPAALARRRQGTWVEIAVGLSEGELVLVEVPGRDDVVAWCNDVFGDVEDGTTVSAQLAVTEWVDALFVHFGSVSLCLIDYGEESAELAARSASSIVRTYRTHQDGLDWLAHPGETDITVDVNVTAVVQAIARAGREVRLMTQREFCLGYGLGEVIADMKHSEQVAASQGEIMDQLRNRSDRLDMEAVIDEDGLGAFKVVLVE